VIDPIERIGFLNIFIRVKYLYIGRYSTYMNMHANCIFNVSFIYIYIYIFVYM
jgi:hypothetical protein